MRDQQDDKQARKTNQQQPNRESNERKRHDDTPNCSDDEPQICRGID